MPSPNAIAPPLSTARFQLSTVNSRLLCSNSFRFTQFRKNASASPLESHTFKTKDLKCPVFTHFQKKGGGSPTSQERGEGQARRKLREGTAASRRIPDRIGTWSGCCAIEFLAAPQTHPTGKASSSRRTPKGPARLSLRRGSGG